MKKLACLCLFVSAASLVGCGADAGGRVMVSGNVTHNGAPLATGTISFLPTDGKGATAGATISNGKYETAIAPGSKKVSITSEQVVKEIPRDPKDPSGEKITETRQVIPPQYNAQTTLTVDIPDSGKQDANFELSGTVP